MPTNLAQFRVAESKLGQGSVGLLITSNVEDEASARLLCWLVLVGVQEQFSLDGEGQGLVGRVDYQTLEGDDTVG